MLHKAEHLKHLRGRNQQGTIMAPGRKEIVGASGYLWP